MGPSVEDIKEGAFLPDWPQNLAKIATPVPTIFGVNDKEGLLIFMNGTNATRLFRIERSITLRTYLSFKT